MAWPTAGVDDIFKVNDVNSLEPGIYRIRDYKSPIDPELERGLLEIYKHPEKGFCFYDQSGEGDCHVPISFLLSEEVERIAGVDE